MPKMGKAWRSVQTLWAPSTFEEMRMHSKKAGSLCSSSLETYCFGFAIVTGAISSVGLSGLPAVLVAMLVVISLHALKRS